MKIPTAIKLLASKAVALFLCLLIIVPAASDAWAHPAARAAAQLLKGGSAAAKGGSAAVAGRTATSSVGAGAARTTKSASLPSLVVAATAGSLAIDALANSYLEPEVARKPEEIKLETLMLMCDGDDHASHQVARHLFTASSRHTHNLAQRNDLTQTVLKNLIQSCDRLLEAPQPILNPTHYLAVALKNAWLKEVRKDRNLGAVLGKARKGGNDAGSEARKADTASRSVVYLDDTTEESGPMQVSAFGANPADIVENQEILRQIFDTAPLTRRQKEALTLAAIGETRSEIAIQMGITEGYVKELLGDARACLRRYYGMSAFD